MALKAATFNVRGMADFHKRKRIFEMSKILEIDVLALQETNCSNIKEGSAWAKEWGGGGQAFWSFALHHMSGVGILSNNKSGLKVESFESQCSGRLAQS